MNYRGKEKGPTLPSYEALSPSPTSVKYEGNERKLEIFRSIGSKIEDKVHWKMIVLLSGVWLAVIHYYERLYVISSMKKCNWSNWETWKKGSQPHRVAIVADPQIVDDYSYEGTWKIALYFIKKVTDNYLYRNHRFMQEYIDPDTTIFLGDLFDGGREWEDAKWLEELGRFNKIFPKKLNRRTIQSIPGNHDIGFQDMDGHVMNRFSAFFGDSNDFWEIGNHSVVFLDTISLSSENEKIRKEPLEFLERIEGRMNPYFPKILFTHVPLYRDIDTQQCGPHRESSKKFPVQKGKQYQTVIESQMSELILQRLTPKIVFSGDDHDYCEINHAYSKDKSEVESKEITVKSVAMSSGIKYPAIQLLSLHNPYDPSPKTTAEKVNSYETNICYMPNSYAPLKIYGFLFALTLLLLFSHSFSSISWTRYISPDQMKAKLEDFELPSVGSKWKPRSKQATRIFDKTLDFVIHALSMLCIIFLLFSLYYRYL